MIGSTMRLNIMSDETGHPGNPIMGFSSIIATMVGFPGLIFIPWIIILWIVFNYNGDKDRDYYPSSEISLKHDSIPVDHSKFAVLQKDFKSGPEVTEACLSCHNGRGKEFMKTEHWKWHKVDSIPGRGTFDLGKKNLLNNFCIGVNSNEKLCSMCHAGYGYGDKNFDFNNQNNIDCLICHDGTKTYHKSNPCKGPNLPGSGAPGVDVDLSFVAVSKEQRVLREVRPYCTVQYVFLNLA